MTSFFDLILFDCDGTLVDSEYLNNKVTSDLLIEFGLTEYTPERCINDFAGTAWSDIRKTLQERHGTIIPDDIIKRYIQTVQAEIPKSLKAVPSAVNLVKTANDHFKICVASNGERTNVCTALSTCGFNPYFHDDIIFTKIQVDRPKPHPDLFLFAAHKMKADPSACLVIEDSPTGVKAGLAAGMTVWGFTGTAHDPNAHAEILIQAGAHDVFHNLIHIPQRLSISKNLKNQSICGG